MTATPSRRSLVFATLATAVALPILIGLGVWQLERLAWKEALIARLTQRLEAAPDKMPPADQWPMLARDDMEFRRVSFSAQLVPGAEAFVYATASPLRQDSNEPGFWVFAPARLADGSTVIVNRGFVPNGKRDPATRAQGAITGAVTFTGLLRWPEDRGMFTPPDDVNGNVWYLRDHNAIAAGKNWGRVAPFYVELEAPVPPGGLPSPARVSTIRLPNSHLQYAVTWFGLAAGLAGVYLVWLLGQRRRR